MSLGKLRHEKSSHTSGLIPLGQIPLLKEDLYIVKNYRLDGDAPKQFIKAYFHTEDSTVRKTSPSSWHGYIAKTAEKWYPHESIIEYMINRAGQVMGLYMNQIKLVRAGGQIRFLSRFFLRDGEKLIHGAEICGEHLGDMVMAREIAENKQTSRELFTFQFITDAIRSVFPQHFELLLPKLVKMIAYDALVGNNDRHFYNWGIIDSTKKTSKPPIFAPIYDSARGLLWNYSDENIINITRQPGNKMVSYLDKACPRISIEENTEANHFELVDFVRRYNTEFDNIIAELASRENEKKVINMLRHEFFPLFIPERQQWITWIINERFKKIRGN